MSIIIFIVVTIISGYVIEYWGTDYIATCHINEALAVLIGLGSAIWYCLTRAQWVKWKKIIKSKNNNTDLNNKPDNE